MLEEIPDIVIGIVCFGSFLILSVLAGGILQRINASRHVQALSKLAPVIHGEVEGDDHSAWMRGVFQGGKVLIKLTPKKNISQSSDYSIKINAFEITMLDVPGTQGWELEYRGMIRKKWEITAQDGALLERLNQADLTTFFEKTGNHTSVRYDPVRDELRVLEVLAPRSTPSEKRF